MGREFVSPQGQAMERISALYNEASALRVLAWRFEMLPLRDRVLDLAARCEMLAKSMEESLQAADLRQKGFPPDLH